MDVTSYLLGKKSGGGSEINNQNKDVTVTENGSTTVSADAGYTGLGTVGITTNVQPDLETKNVTINSNTTTTIEPTSGKDGLSQVNVTTSVTPDLESKSVTITENGTTTVTPTSGKDGLSQVAITTDVSGSGAYDYFYEGAPNVNYSSVGPWYSLVKKIPGPIDFTGNMTDMFMNFKGTQLPVITHSGLWASMKSFRKLFQGCENLTALPDISNWNTSYVENMNSMYADCKNITNIDVSNFNTEKVTDMGYMFSGCTKIESLNLLNFDTSKTPNMSYMFLGCSKLKTIQCNLDFTACTNLRDIFANCTELENIGTLSNIGKGYLTSQSAHSNNYKVNLNGTYNLTHTSLMNIINGLYDIATAGVQQQDLALGSQNIAKLSQAELDIATNKGWNVY